MEKTKIKHSKFKNPYLIYEFLTKQIAVEVIHEKKAIKESKAYKIIQKYFKRGALKEEYDLYDLLVNVKMQNKYSAEQLLNECVTRQTKLNQSELRRSKYNLVKEIKESYDIDKLFSTSVPEYKECASVFILFEGVCKNDIVTKSKYSGVMLENIMTPKNKNKEHRIMEAIDKASPDERKIMYKLIVNSFNKKFSTGLNEGQKKFVQDYIYSTTLENGWIYEHINKLKKDLGKYSKDKLNKSDNDSKVLGIKINECVNKLKQLESKKIFKEEDFKKILSSYKLTEYLETL
jgi:hypothetical protein